MKVHDDGPGNGGDPQDGVGSQEAKKIISARKARVKAALGLLPTQRGLPVQGQAR
jgi:hypothetical protein